MILVWFFLNLFPRDGHGQILFWEFVSWALEKNLDIEDDIDWGEKLDPSTEMHDFILNRQFFFQIRF